MSARHSLTIGIFLVGMAVPGLIGTYQHGLHMWFILAWAFVLFVGAFSIADAVRPKK